MKDQSTPPANIVIATQSKDIASATSAGYGARTPATILIILTIWFADICLVKTPADLEKTSP